MERFSKAAMALLVIVVCISAAGAADLPISRVVLFSSGVGYFERVGDVTGTQEVSLSFTTQQINDLLKSLIVQDFDGGKIAPVVYAPQEPALRALKSFAVDLSAEKSLAEMLTALRGARVEVDADGTLRGQVLGVETQQKSGEKAPVEFEVLNLVTEAGIKQVPIWHIKAIRLLDPKLSDDLAKALGVLAASHDSGKRPLTLTFVGEGKRRVRVGYLLETPVWKTSYRLVNDEKGMLLQGWAIVENTTDDDWHAVRLALVSGRPISFIQDLYQPLYVQRPTVAPSVIGSPPPQTYEGNMDKAGEEQARPEAQAPAPPRGAMGKAARKPTELRMLTDTVAGTAFQSDRYATTSAQAMASGDKVGELFQYAIDQPVSIARQRSAMIPILSQNITGEKVSVYNQRVNAKFPLNGLKLKNSTALHLMGGPVTVFDGGIYGGDALINDIAPGDERLLTYAVDIGVEVDPKAGDGTQELTSLKIVRGTLIATRKQRSEMNYTAKNVTAEKRTLLIEYPIVQGWELKAPAKADETTRDVYRFKVAIAPKTTGKLQVIAERPLSQTIGLVDCNPDLLVLYAREPKISPELKAALEAIVAKKGAIAEVAAQWTQRDARLREIAAEQDRIRKNMAELDRGNDLYKRYVDKLTAQETEFERLQGEIKKLQEQQKGLQNELTAYIAGLNVE